MGVGMEVGVWELGLGLRRSQQRRWVVRMNDLETGSTVVLLPG